MVGSVNNGFQQSIPASRAFEPNQAPQNSGTNASSVQQGSQGIQNQRAAPPPAGTPDLTPAAASSADSTRINLGQNINTSQNFSPNQNFAAGQDRGSVLDISA